VRFIILENSGSIFINSKVFHPVPTIISNLKNPSALLFSWVIAFFLNISILFSISISILIWERSKVDPMTRRDLKFNDRMGDHNTRDIFGG
jgi:hypothetical protein